MVIEGIQWHEIQLHNWSIDDYTSAPLGLVSPHSATHPHWRLRTGLKVSFNCCYHVFKPWYMARQPINRVLQWTWKLPPIMMLCILVVAAAAAAAPPSPLVHVPSFNWFMIKSQTSTEYKQFVLLFCSITFQLDCSSFLLPSFLHCHPDREQMTFQSAPHHPMNERMAQMVR